MNEPQAYNRPVRWLALALTPLVACGGSDGGEDPIDAGADVDGGPLDLATASWEITPVGVRPASVALRPDVAISAGRSVPFGLTPLAAVEAPGSGRHAGRRRVEVRGVGIGEPDDREQKGDREVVRFERARHRTRRVGRSASILERTNLRDVGKLTPL